MGAPAGDYHRGEMDISEQKRTFSAFIGVTKWFSLALAVVLVPVILFTSAGVNFLGSVVTGGVLLVLGVLLLRDKRKAH